jgi:hypothetical protein
VQEADEAAGRLLKIEPENPQSWVTAAAAATRLLQQERALEAYEKAAALKPDEELIRLSIGHAQKTLGRRSDSEASYKAALAINPAMGAAYWSLADLKNYTFSDAEISAMQGLLQQDLPREGGAAALRARQGLRATAGVPQSLRTLRTGQHAAPARCPLRHRRLRAPQRAHPGFFRPGILRRARRRRRPQPRAHLHRGAATLGVHAARADPRQPLRVEGTMDFPMSSPTASVQTWGNCNGYPDTLKRPSTQLALGGRYLRRPRRCVSGASTSSSFSTSSSISPRARPSATA